MQADNGVQERIGSRRRAGLIGGYFVLLIVMSADARAERISFARQVRPILKQHCLECHGGITRKAGLSLASRSLATSAAKSGRKPIVPGDEEASGLVLRITSDDPDERMPPKGGVTGAEVKLLRQWIAEGADWPRQWSLEPVTSPVRPQIMQVDRARNAIDHFVLARLEAEGLTPSPEADRRTLIRRLSLDLTGLLPSPDEVDVFVGDPSATAYETLVDRLLASEHFGERWGRHWLDEARYADSSGYEKDSPRQDAYRWRDWVIRAINEDLPFDQFTIQQIAGDLLPRAGRPERLATAFQLMTQFNLEGGVDAEEDRTKRVKDVVNTIGAVWLGASVGCASCHDHPYDPFTQQDYYRLYAFFDNADFEAIYVDGFPDDAERRIIERHEEWSKVKDLLDRQVNDKNLATQLQGALTRLRRNDNARGMTRVVVERKEDRRRTYLFERGEFLRPDKALGEIQPGTSAVWPVLNPRARSVPLTAEQKRKKLPAPPLPPDRLDLAHWLVRPDHPATARVTVNKIWLHLFGRGLSDQPQDFGVAGSLPSHPELLDWLAHHFVHEVGWSRKRMIREILLSATYRQSSDLRPELRERDPGNRLLARQSRFRVEAEIVRDLHLQAAGLLNPTVGGPSVFPPIPADIAALSYANNFKWTVSKGDDRYRRGMYTFYKRTAPDPNLTLFDCPDAAITLQQRVASNTPLQALATLQNEVFVDAARAFAGRLSRLEGGDDRGRLQHAFRVTVGRAATRTEEDTLMELLQASRDWYGKHPGEAARLVGDAVEGAIDRVGLAAWIAVGRIVLNTDEFITRS